MPKASVGLLVLLYCLKTLGWVAATVGVFLALSYLRTWLLTAWKKELERSSSDRDRNVDEEDFSVTDSRVDRVNTQQEGISPSRLIVSGLASSPVVSTTPKHDL